MSKSTRKTILTGGLTIFVVHIIVGHLLFFVVLGGFTFTQGYQYISSSVMGAAAYEAGAATIFLLGGVIHFLTSLIMSAFFFFLRGKLAFMQTRTTMWALLYGAGAGVFMNAVVLPLSIVYPPFDPTVTDLVMASVLHLITVGGSLAYTLRREAKA